MGLNKYGAAGSAVLTSTVWNNQMNDIGSEIDITYGFQTGSDYYTYDASNNLLSGNHFSTTGSWYEWYEYDSGNVLISGHTIKDGRQVDSSYYYDNNNNLSGTQFKVV